MLARARAFGLAGAALVLAGLAGAARAQTEARFLVLPANVTGAASTERSPTRAASASLAAGFAGSPRVYAPKDARALFEQRGSTAPLTVSHSDLDALARDAQMALYHVAGGLHARARQDVERALARADKVLESLNRESLAAQQLLDACLYLVRAHLQSGLREQARTQALECRRLVPDIEPDGTMHPPDVIGVLAEAEARLRLQSPGSLRIESVPDGCAVFVNGRRLGTAPLELPQLGPGEYRVQAECEEGVPGRVHRATIGSTRVVVRADTRFDAAVQTQLDLSLRYDNADEQRAHAYEDAVEVGRIVGVADVIVVSISDASAESSTASRVAPSAGTGPSGALEGKQSTRSASKPAGGGLGAAAEAVVQIERIRVADGALQAAVRARVDARGELVSRDAVVRALRGRERVDLTGSGSAPLAIDARTPGAPAGADRPAAERTASAASTSGPASAPPDAALDGLYDDEGATNDGPPYAAAIAVGASGGAGLLAGWALWARQLDLELTYSDEKDAGKDYASTLRDVEGGEALAPMVGGASAIVATASLPWLLPEADGLPLWGAIVGGAGAAVAAGGALFLVQGAGCDEFDLEGRCTDVLATTRLGALMIETASPMLGVPVTYWLRGALGGGAHASASAGREGAVLRIGGAL